MNKKPKILYYDIETAPMLAWIWRPGFKISVSHTQLYDGMPTGIICVCYKWAGEKKIHNIDWGLKEQDSEKVVKEFDKIYQQADIAIGHNGDNFDAKHFNTQRMVNRLPPVSWIQSEDTLKQVRRHFNLPSNKLDYLAELLLGEGKAPMGFQDWIDIVEHKKRKALDKMVKYCKRDVLLLQGVEEIIAPYVDHKVHRGLLVGKDRDACPNCAGEVSHKWGIYTTKSGRFQRYKCTECGHVRKDTRQVKKNTL